MKLMGFQREFIRAATAPDTLIAALSGPRGLGKTTLVAHLAHRFLTPGDQLHRPDGEAHIIAASMGQARRTTFKQLRGMIGDDPQFKIAESVNNAFVRHKPSGANVSVLAASGKTAQGLVDVDWIFGDEPGAWEITGGQLVADALETALEKPGSRMKIIYIGTLAPHATGAGHWYYDLIAGGGDPESGTYVTRFAGDPKQWDSTAEIRRSNPLMWRDAKSRKRLLQERDKARADTRLKARFLSYRLNVPSADESDVLLAVDDFERACSRPEALPGGKPIVGIDLGGGRAWSAAVAIWQSGRVEALAVAPGIPGLAEQEKRDRFPAGTYQRLADLNQLRVATGLRVQPPATMVAAIRERWGNPAQVICDRFRLAELQDAAPGWNIKPRVTRWSEASEDIRTLRRIAADGPLFISGCSRALIAASLSVAMVKNDDQGSVRLSKRGSHNQARDDVAAALLLAAGEWERHIWQPKPAWRYVGMVG